VKSRDKSGFYGFGGAAREYFGGSSHDGHLVGRCMFQCTGAYVTYAPEM